MEEELLIRRYFDAWVHQNASDLEKLFDPDIVYTECYGPEYRGIEQIKRWFSDWNRHGEVLKWEIRRFFKQGKQAAVEWYFECVFDGVVSGFDGVSLVVFNRQGAILELKEYQSKSEHVFPYGVR